MAAATSSYVTTRIPRFCEVRSGYRVRIKSGVLGSVRFFVETSFLESRNFHDFYGIYKYCGGQHIGWTLPPVLNLEFKYSVYPSGGGSATARE